MSNDNKKNNSNKFIDDEFVAEEYDEYDEDEYDEDEYDEDEYDEDEYDEDEYDEDEYDEDEYDEDEYDEDEYDEDEYDEDEYDEDEYDEDEYDEDEYAEDEYAEDEYDEDDDVYVNHRYDNGIMLVDEKIERPGFKRDFPRPSVSRPVKPYSNLSSAKKEKGGSANFIDQLKNLNAAKIKEFIFSLPQRTHRGFSSFGEWLRNLSRGKKIALAVVLSLLLIIVILTSWACSYLNRLFDGFNYETEDDHTVSFTDQLIKDDEGLLDGVSYADVDAEQLFQEINEVTVDENNLFHQDGTTNILLLGTDNRKVGGHARSDAIILLSINRNTEQIVMTSFLRDTAVAFNGASYTDKLTHGYAYGKGPLMVKTIQSHYGVKIDYYMAIDFFAFMDMVDYLGGINLDITESERNVMNRYVRQINKLLGKPEESGLLLESGKNIKVTGKQALGYARNRYSSDEGDFGRTNRQRIILGKIIDKLKADPTKALGLLEEIAPRVKTDFPKDELMSEVMNILDYVSYEVVTGHIPADDTWHYGSHNGMSLVVCDFKPNQRILIKSIYGVDMDTVISEHKEENQ